MKWTHEHGYCWAFFVTVYFKHNETFYIDTPVIGYCQFTISKTLEKNPPLSWPEPGTLFFRVGCLVGIQRSEKWGAWFKSWYLRIFLCLSIYSNLIIANNRYTSIKVSLWWIWVLNLHITVKLECKSVSWKDFWTLATCSSFWHTTNTVFIKSILH